MTTVNRKTDAEIAALLAQCPPPPDGAPFALHKVERVSMPHPYCITPKHVTHAADHHGGMLDATAIESAERAGAKCDICRERNKKLGEPILPYSQHETQVALFIEVEQNGDLNAVPGLGAYLSGNKEAFTALGIEGFAFPQKRR